MTIETAWSMFYDYKKCLENLNRAKKSVCDYQTELDEIEKSIKPIMENNPAVVHGGILFVLRGGEIVTVNAIDSSSILVDKSKDLKEEQ